MRLLLGLLSKYHEKMNAMIMNVSRMAKLMQTFNNGWLEFSAA